tara:strand:+ start:4667 stop:4999 length:333 start_codon:yes stop_codon:yes gene_type:complete
MSIRKHYIIIGNQRHGYTLHPAQKVTHLICRSANIEARFPNDEIPRILAELPSLIAEQRALIAHAQQNQVIRFRVSADERALIEQKVRDHGYDTISAYLRDVALHRIDTN